MDQHLEKVVFVRPHLSSDRESLTLQGDPEVSPDADGFGGSGSHFRICEGSNESNSVKQYQRDLRCPTMASVKVGCQRKPRYYLMPEELPNSKGTFGYLLKMEEPMASRCVRALRVLKVFSDAGRTRRNQARHLMLDDPRESSRFSELEGPQRF